MVVAMAGGKEVGRCSWIMAYSHGLTWETEEDREGDCELTKRIFAIGDETVIACSSVDQTTAFSATSCSRRGDDGAMTEQRRRRHKKKEKNIIYYTREFPN
jgi:hypothetical protein